MSMYDKDEFESLPFSRTCKYCGKSGLEWQIDRATGKYALYDNKGKLHNCCMVAAAQYEKPLYNHRRFL